MKFEYVWLDGYKPEPTLRSKVKIDDYADLWSFDGSSTQQATGDKSDCILKPVAEYTTIAVSYTHLTLPTNREV